MHPLCVLKLMEKNWKKDTTWSLAKTESLKGYMMKLNDDKKLPPEEKIMSPYDCTAIGNLMGQPPSTIAQEITKIKNPKKRMICPKENIIKDDMGHGEYAQYLTGFDSARILIDDKNEV